jgi:branched-chain amino acid transport system ATP-binding protein
LSPLIVEQMAAAVIAMKREGIAVLLSEQNLHFASAVADRVIVVETGHVRYVGTMTEFVGDTQLRARYLAV